MSAHIAPNGVLMMRKKHVPSSSIYATREVARAKIVIADTTEKTTRITGSVFGPR